MTEQEDFVVREPYQPTQEEMQAIKKLEDKGLVPDDWNSRKKYIKSFKKNLSQDMYIKQNQLCTYCRIHVPKACSPMDREHIVYKDKHPQWMFLPENLCLACSYCNKFKGITEVLTNPLTTVYPNASDGFKIIHPLYDKYSEHIELIGGILYQGKTPKGIFTIKTCHLYRVELAEERVDEKMYVENKGNIVAELIHLLPLSTKYVNDNEKFVQYVKNIVKKYKQEQVR